MFCDNISYHTNQHQQNFTNCCGSQPKPNANYNYIPTQKSQRNPSHLFNNMTSSRQYQDPVIYNKSKVNQIDTLQLINQNTRRQNKKVQAVQRNKNISVILSIVLAFSQRIQTLKQKLCGYPAQNFYPAQYFNVLDLTQKGYVDIYDIKRFVNNQKIRQKDIISLFKRVNGDHSKDNRRLSYFGYLNLIKPYFNQQLARDLLLRDTYSKKSIKTQRSQHFGLKIDNQMIEPTQQSVLLLFQQLMLLHCICSAQHQQAKQLLMNDYMLNTIQIKQILGLDVLDSSNPKYLSPKKDSSRVKHKNALAIIFQFIQNNSQFQIQFQQMKYILSFLNCHQFSLINDKYMSLLFLPTNCKKQILKQLQKRKTQIEEIQGTQNYMNTYLTKQNLLNRGNIQTIKNYLNQKAQYSLTGNHVNFVNNTLAGNKANFLQFVHPRSIQRTNFNLQHPNQVKLLNQQHIPAHLQQVLTPHPATQHPQFLINVSNKQLSNGSGVNNFIKMSPSERQYSNSSSIPQQNIRIYAPKQSIHQPNNQIFLHQDYKSSKKQNNQFQQGLKNEFYESKKDDIDMNSSKLANTPFLEQFMKRSNILKNYQKNGQNTQMKRKIINQQDSQIQSSSNSNSAFEVVDYAYQQSRYNHYPKSNTKNQPDIKRYVDESQRIKKQTLDSRYNMVISQYKNNPNNKSKDKSQNINQSSGPKFQKSYKRPQNQNIIINYSKGNYIDNVGLSQSNMVNQSNLLNKFSSGGAGNILSQFMKN